MLQPARGHDYVSGRRRAAGYESEIDDQAVRRKKRWRDGRRIQSRHPREEGDIVANHLPDRGRRGTFTRLLAGQANHVTAIDPSGEMIRIARHRSTGYPNIDYLIGDVSEMDLPAGQFDCIVMIATLHHLPTESAPENLKQALRPEGVLILHDLLTPTGILDKAANLVRFPVNMAMRYLRTGRLLARKEARRDWAEHGKAAAGCH